MSGDAKEVFETREGAFFGATVPVLDIDSDEEASVAPGEVSDDGVEVEVVDDRSPDDRDRPPVDYDDVGEDMPDDGDDLLVSEEELRKFNRRSLSARLAKVTAQKHEERRRREAAEKLADEASQFARTTFNERNRLSQLVSESQKALVEQARHRAKGAMEIAKKKFEAAHEAGDTAAIAEAQQEMTNAQLAAAQAPAVAQQIIRRWQSQAQKEQAQPGRAHGAPPQTPQPPEPSEKAVAWEKQNPWFGVDRVMTSTAYGVHEELISSGQVTPDSDEYYKRINAEMRKIFPQKFGSSSDADTSSSDASAVSAPRRGAPVVAPAARNNGSVPRKVQLTATQVRLAKRIGITPQQLAEQILKESRS